MNRQYNKRQIIHNAFLRCVYILILCLGSMGIYGQQQAYPVQVYTQLTPPYTPHIPAYYTGTQAKLKVMLINTDMQQPLVKVYLRMKILSSSFSAVTPAEVYTPQIELQAGMPMTLSLNDLEPYFKKENLRVSGGQSEFYRTQMLPDNFYRFHFEVYEEGTNRLVSNPKIGFAQAMIAAGEPPILNLPLKGSVIKESNIPSIMFSWTPRHMNSVAAAYGTEYDISLVEIYDKQVAPEAAFDYSRVLYTETTKSTSFIHTVAQPLLIPGLRYAWRVQAKAREGVNEISVFKNNGYSPISWFDYTADCKTVQNCGAIYENGHVDISWQDLGAMEYTVEYRKKGTSRWYTGVINKALLSQLYNLQAGKDYEYRIGSRCVIGDAFQYNNPQAFHIPDRQVNGPNCGLMPDINLTNQTPTRELQSGMPVLVGDFPVFITKVSGSGKFTGEGYVGIPYLQGAQIAVTFKDIVVNTDNRLVSGYFETKYDTKNNNLLFDADQYQTGGKGVGDIRSGEEQAAFKVDYTINPDIKALPVKADGTKDEITGGKDYTIAKGENGKYTFVLTDSQGKEHKVEADAMPATIEDKNGNTYEVSEKGEVKPVSKNSDIKLDSSTKDTQSKLSALSFKSTKNTKYALDEYRDVYDKVTEYKDQYKAEGTAITASAKFMLPGASDEIAVYIKENKDNKLIPEKVRFVTGKGKEYSATYDSQTKGWTLTIVGGQANDGQELYVVQDVGKDKYETLGKLNIFTYEPLKRSVTLVPVNGKNNNLDRQTVQDGLNEIYGKIGISWTVNVLEKPFSYTPKNGSTFNVTGSGLLSMFTDDMTAINEVFKQSGEYQKDGLYLFVLPFNASDKGEISGTNGDMPLGSQFGYLFPGASIRTIAHEVGHGAFNLEHPFDRPLRISFPQKGMLEYNLMEYPTKDAEKWRELVKIQWDATRAPGHVIGLFQTDKSGMAVKSNIEALSAFQENSRYTFFTPDRKCITIPATDLKNVYFSTATYLRSIQSEKITDKQIKDYYPLGSLCAFELNSGKYYAAVKNRVGQITGYYLIKGDTVTDEKNNYPITACSDAICLFFTKNELEENIFGAGIFSKGFGENNIADFDVEDVTLPIDFGLLKHYAKDNIVKPIENLSYTLRDTEGYKPTGKDKREPFDEEKYDKFLNELSTQLSNQYKQGSGIIRDFEFKNEGYEYAIADISDRLIVFDREVKDTKFIVHFATAPCDIPKDSLDNISQRVVERSRLGDKKLVYLLAPGWDRIYWETGDYFPSTATSVELCVYNTVSKASTPVGQQNSKNIITDIVNIYRQIPKPYYLLKHFITGSEFGVYTTYTEVEKLGTVTGKDHIHDYALIVDSRIWGVDALESKKLWEQVGAAFAEMDAQYAYTPNPMKDEEYYARQKAMQEEIDSYYSIHQLDYKRVPHGLRESYLMGTGGTLGIAPYLYTEWYLSSLEDFLFVRMYKNDLKDEYFISGRNDAMGEDILTTLDAVGLALSPWGGDVVTDVIGVGVAGYYKKPGQAALYASSAMVPFISAGAVKFSLKGAAEIKGLAKGTHIAEEAADGTLTIINKATRKGISLTSEGKFVDNLLESDFQKYLLRKTKEGKPPKDRSAWKEARDYWLNDSPMARGNKFNDKAVKEDWYRYNEVHLENGKRLDAYNEELGEIVSRKATDLEDIQIDTFESYLKEMKQKYAPGTKINSPKYGKELEGKSLQGQQILEIPESNKSFDRIQEYIDLAKNKYDIEIRFKPE